MALCRSLGLGLALALALPAAAFEGFIDAPGSHMEATRTGLHEAFQADFSLPTPVSTMPGYGITTYRWPSYKATDLMSDASRDIDSWFFGPLYPHAQTPEFNYRKAWTPEQLRKIELSAVWDYLRHMATWMARVEHLYQEGRKREATYLLGVLLHSYEDLWAHRGITNAMHLALLSVRGLDVDRAPERVSELRSRLSTWLPKLPSLLGDSGPAFLAYLLSGQELEAPSTAERSRLLGRGRDIFVQGIVFKYLTRKDPVSLDWQSAIEWDVDCLDGILGDKSAYTAILAMGDRSELVPFLEARAYRF